MSQQEPLTRKKGLDRIVSAFLNSLKGIRYLLAEETAFQQEFWLCVVLIPAVFYLDISAVERVLLLGSLFLVLIVEILNTAIERTVDRIGLEHHPLSGLAKDLASLAVLLSLIFALGTWLMILLA